MDRDERMLALQNSGYNDEEAARLADERDLMDTDECELCGEDADGETGFFTGHDGEMVWAHGQCGEDEGLELA